MDFISQQFDIMKKEQEANKKRIAELEKEMKEKDEIIFNLHARTLESEMYVRNRNLEIHGVAEDRDEKVEEIVCKVAAAVGVQLSSTEIEAAHRVPTKKPAVPRPIVVQLSSRKKREEIISKKKEEVYNKQVNHKKTGEGRVFVYEQLPQEIRVDVESQR